MHWEIPHFQANGVRLPLDIEGAIAGRSNLLPDPQLREFAIGKPWGESSARLIGPASYGDWSIERSTPPLDSPAPISAEKQECLMEYVAAIPGEESDCDPEVWNEIVERGDQSISIMGCQYLAAHIRCVLEVGA